MSPHHPDPTIDLDWSGFVGSIQDIFTKNALKHPERLCTEETGPPARYFNYKQIDEASNVLAHHFVQSGIQRGDVIMTYAYRGVELVVAVMGILKAGATFSVLDPSYPALRQIDYLDISRPRALISIARATREAGQLEENVRSFIDTELSLVTEIPGLELADDGTLIGGKVLENDILAPLQEKKSQGPRVVVGPDSVPTLSFTSGSEGKPKGVRGRHFSLAYYFNWMAEKFNLSADDKFTMLSGIAHDPIQRDIFTPLFLGAQILVPSPYDIQYEKLAEWMAKYEATVTHLTPAMGQVLVGNAEAKFPKLHHAFFVGDKLLKKDCRALQRLAANVRIVNMYGTTETQRSVSFKEIPSISEDPLYLDKLGDHIPAGQGMKNVQLLVVNREDRSKICNVGEEGEIYVRAGGLAEGYLGLPDLTSQKFVTNWFVDAQKWQEAYATQIQSEQVFGSWREFYKGPRDRLYRTGDLGKYNSEGDVEATGRADQQIKIRGFRIELGEIDNFISYHPVVRENITVYLETDPRQEKDTLISFYVPETKAWDGWAEEQKLSTSPLNGNATMLERYLYYDALSKDIRQSLSKRLREFEMPRYIVPLPQMPLNPNGKVDRRRLPVEEFFAIPRLALSGNQVTQNGRHLTAMEDFVADIWIEAVPSLSKDQLAENTTYDSVGIDSNAIFKILHSVRTKYKQVNLTHKAVYSNPSLGAFATLLEKVSTSQESETSSDSEDYSQDARNLCNSLPDTFEPHSFNSNESKGSAIVLLTGATGFLGAYILRELMSRTAPVVKSLVVLVRSQGKEDGLGRIKETCAAYGIWNESWASRIRCVPCNLGNPNLGVSDADWQWLSQEVNVIIHNAATVHWLRPYSDLKAVNVQSTLDLIRLCSVGIAKQFTFISSTSVLDSQAFQNLPQQISDDDDLDRSKTGLPTGYGQTKWASEYITREAGHRGLRGSIVRPGYVTGDSKSGVTIEDDFLVRLLKGCIQVAARPDLLNTINMVPVDHVARLTVAAAFYSAIKGEKAIDVVQVDSHPRLNFNQYLSALETFGFKVPLTTYQAWSTAIKDYVAGPANNKEPHALLPLFHMVTESLPEDSIAPEMNDKNAKLVLLEDEIWTGLDSSARASVNEEIVGLYLGFLAAVGFINQAPDQALAKPLPPTNFSADQVEAWTRRSSGRKGR